MALVNLSAEHGPLTAEELREVFFDNKLTSFVAGLIKTRQYADLLDKSVFCSSSFE